MKIIGIILIVLECLALFGNITSGGAIFAFGGIREIFRFIGFLLPGIVGVILVYVGSKKKKK